MKVIGITGGVGAGKSAVLRYMSENYATKVIYADEVAHKLMAPGGNCHDAIGALFEGEQVFFEDGSVDKKLISQLIFNDDKKRSLLNAIVHPAVKEYILEQIEKERQKEVARCLVIEAALLIENDYDKICDEIWYVYASQKTRIARLKKDRGYSDEKIQAIFDSQLSEEEFRKVCDVVIDNDSDIDTMKMQVSRLMRGDLPQEIATDIKEDKMEENTGKQREHDYVFGLDIGTRNVVGTVGYKDEDEHFVVVAQFCEQHSTRSMLDGQIHDIAKVGKTVKHVKEKLEEKIGFELTDVCIAAAGRVLKTVNCRIDYEYPQESVVTSEDIHTLDLLGVDKAQQILKENNDTNFKFYCVGYSVVKYYLNDDMIKNLESHKAEKISEDIIATFLPEDVVDGLYTSVGLADLKVANLTLEPIAAINVAIPEQFRLLNIALVDVGAGTSDISVTKDGSIIAYGMIPHAGDEITETIVQHYLVDFKTAEEMKLASEEGDKIEYEDIMNIKHTITSKELWDLVEPVVENIASEVAAKIKELNAGESVSATFVVGGGGKIHGFTKKLASLLDLPDERVALRGEQVLKEVEFIEENIVKDPLIVTPVGICLNYYDQKNNFIFVRFNGEMVKLYDNDKLTIVDAAMQAGFPNEYLFPRRGKEINFTVGAKSRIVRGTPGESAIVKMNGHLVSINTPLEPNCEITIEASTQGDAAVYTLAQLPEYETSTLVFRVNGQDVRCPRFVEVNGSLEPPTYCIQEGDRIEVRSYYTVEQLIEFMDIEIDEDSEILVNNRPEDLKALVYENFEVQFDIVSFRTTQEDINKENEIRALELEKELEDIDSEDESRDLTKEDESDNEPLIREVKSYNQGEEKNDDIESTEDEEDEIDIKIKAVKEILDNEEAKKDDTPPSYYENEFRPNINKLKLENLEKKKVAAEKEEIPAYVEISVNVNGSPVRLKGKESYIFVDVFDYIDFDLKASNGRAIATKLNGKNALYGAKLSEGDKIDIEWIENEKRSEA